MRRNKRNQGGFSIIELLVCIVIISILGVALMDTLLGVKKAIPKVQADLAAGKAGPPLAQRFADEKLNATRTGMILVTKTGTVQVDPTEDQKLIEGWRFGYSADVKVFDDGFHIVTVTIAGSDTFRTCATADYWVEPPPPPPGGGGDGGGDDGGDGGGGGPKH